jgi:hypothetical protein
MTAHDVAISIMPAPDNDMGRAVCSCGWEGPARDMTERQGEQLVRLDGAVHAEEMRRGGS